MAVSEVRHYSDGPAVSFDHMPELAGYTEEPQAMYVGAPGKRGYLNLGFEIASSGRTVMSELDRRAPLIVQQELYFDKELPDLPCVYILSSGGPNVDGDRFVQNFFLKKGAMAFISTGAATKLASMKSNYSGMRQTITLEDDAYLEFLPEPVIPHAHTRYISDTKIVIAESATLFYSEIYMPGRKYYKDGEIFKYDVLSVCSHAERPDARQLFREKFVIAPKDLQLRNLGIMAGYDVFANAFVLTPESCADHIYETTEAYLTPKLAQGITRLPQGAGLLLRVLGQEPGPVKAAIRSFCSTVRQAVKGRPMPAEFPWR